MTFKLFVKLFLSITVLTAVLISCEEDNQDDSCLDPSLVAQFDSTNCPLLAQPVCACNNVTYLNECLANQAGFAIQDTVPCSQL